MITDFFSHVWTFAESLFSKERRRAHDAPGSMNFRDQMHTTTQQEERTTRDAVEPAEISLARS